MTGRSLWMTDRSLWATGRLLWTTGRLLWTTERLLWTVVERPLRHGAEETGRLLPYNTLHLKVLLSAPPGQGSKAPASAPLHKERASMVCPL